MAFPCEIVEVPHRIGAHCLMIKTSSVHKEYTTFIQIVDVADYVRGLYDTQTRTHKWWYRIFWFLIRTSIDNMWILHKAMLIEKDCGNECLTHFQLIIAICKALTRNWIGNKMSISLLAKDVPKIHCSLKSHLQCICILCNRRINSYCAQCGFQWQCYTHGCYVKLHHIVGIY